MQGWLRTLGIVIGMVVVGLFAAEASEWLISARGTIGPTVMQATSPANAVMALVAVTIFSSICGSVVAKLSTTNSGMFVFGFSYFILAMNLVGIEEFILTQGNIWLLMVEATFVACLILLGTLLVFAIGGPMKDVSKDDIFTSFPLIRLIWVSAASIPFIWIIAQSPMKGQVVGATAVGGIAVGILARKFLPSVQPIVLFALPVAFASIGYFIGMQLSPLTDTVFMQQSLSGLLYPMPLEYAGGIVIGVAIGLNWGVSMSTQEGAQTELS